MNSQSIKLHHKLYKARAIDEAIKLAKEKTPDLNIKRQREKDHYIVELSGVDKEDAKELLADIADASLLF